MADKLGTYFIDYAFKHAPTAMAMLTLNGEWIRVNPALLQMTGYTNEELLSQPYYEIFHPDDRSVEAGFRERLYKKEEEYLIVEKRFLHKDGHIMWASLTATIAFNEAGEPQFYIVQAQDITRRIQDDWNMKSNEEHYRTLLDNSPDPISLYCEGKIVYTNRAGARLVGARKASDIIGKNMTSFLHPDYLEMAAEVIGKISSTGKPVYDIDVKLVGMTGQVYDIIVSSVPTTYQKKPAIQFSFKDNTIRKTLEETLIDSQNRLRGIFNMAGVGIALMDIQTRKPVDCNPALELYLGYTKDEIESLTFVDVSHSEDIDRNSELFTQMANGTIDSYQIEKRYIRKDGREVWGVLTVSILDNQSQYAVAIVHDITDTKIMEQKLKEANEKLTKLSYLDGLTEIHNRRYFDSAIEEEWNKAVSSHYPLSLIFFDIDHFKLYNDTYGHQSGDDCLKKIAFTVKKILATQSAILARYGGEEFVAILPHCPQEKAYEMAEFIRKAIENLCIPHRESPNGPYVTISLGIAALEERTTRHYEDLILEADCALYSAKQGLRNTVGKMS